MNDVVHVKAADVPRNTADDFSFEFLGPDTTGVSSLMAGRFRTGPGLRIPPHHHTCATIAYLVAGRAIFRAGPDLEREIVMEPGDYVVVGAGVLHVEETVGNSDAEFFLARDNGGGETIPANPDDPFWQQD